MPKIYRSSPAVSNTLGLLGNNTPVRDNKFGLRVTGSEKPIYAHTPTFELTFNEYNGVKIIDPSRSPETALSWEYPEGHTQIPRVSGVLYDGDSLSLPVGYGTVTDDYVKTRFRTVSGIWGSGDFEGTMMLWGEIDSYPEDGYTGCFFNIAEKDADSYASILAGQRFYISIDYTYNTAAPSPHYLLIRAGKSIIPSGTNTFIIYLTEDPRGRPILFTVNTITGGIWVNSKKVLDFGSFSIGEESKLQVLSKFLTSTPHTGKGLKINSFSAFKDVSFSKDLIREIYLAGPRSSSERLEL